MKCKIFFMPILLVAISGFFSLKTKAVDLDWTGLYRIEGYRIVNSEVSSSDNKKSYGLHHLILQPKIIASDSIAIYARFDLFNSDSASHSNSQMGQFFGSGINVTEEEKTTSLNDSNVLSDRQKSEKLEITELYMTYTYEHGVFIVGRTPLHFGLGITHNAGKELFDHWFDKRDLVGVKLIMGNFYFLPMWGKVAEGELSQSDDVTDYMIQVEYENPETDLEMGFFYHSREASAAGNDAPKGSSPGEVFGGNTSVDNGQLDIQTTNFYVTRGKQRVQFGLEASLQKGKTGVQSTSGGNTSVSGFAVATELEYRPEKSKYLYGLKVGMASGDNPETDGKYEGYLFDKNYDVAFLMFNHPLGQKDFLRTSLAGSDAGAVPINSADVETISNAIYVSPYINYVWKENWEVQSRLVVGYLSKTPLLGVKVDKELGYELDVELSYSPKKGVMWVTEVGFLFPGEAFKGDGSLSSEFGYGLSTKAAISF